MSGFFSAIGSFISTLFTIAILLIVAVGVIAFFGYNKLRHLSESINEAFSNIRIALSKKINLINQLQEVALASQESEKFVMLKVSSDVSNTASAAQLYQQSGTVLSTVSGMAQKFPELKANEQYIRVMGNIENCERELQSSRLKYNQAVKEYNVHRSSIPHVFYSTTLGFRAASYVEFSGADQVEDMGTLKSFSSDSDGERLNQLLGVAGTKALEFGSKALESGRVITAKAIEGGKALAETAQEKMREKSDGNATALAPPLPVVPQVPEALYYFLDADNKPQGPVSLSKIKEDVANGQLPEGVLLAQMGSDKWVTLSAI